jgi:hypothetical protein
MKSNVTRTEKPILTIADLCEALADGRLAADRDGEYYTVRRQDFRRFVQSAEITHLHSAPKAVARLIAAS